MLSGTWRLLYLRPYWLEIHVSKLAWTFSFYFLDGQESNKEGHPDTSPSGSLRFSIDMAATQTRYAQTLRCSPPYQSAMLGWL